MIEAIKSWDVFGHTEENLTCKPLDTYEELRAFEKHPPPWSSLCVNLQPHLKFLLKNCEIVCNMNELELEKPLPFCHFDQSKQSNFKLHAEDCLSKTLVCHKTAKGYHDDSIVDGTGAYDVYTFYNWAGIDIFCYFSHHLITIPPLAWINVGHEHGVKVIGTIITEWAKGIAFWTKVLSSESEMNHCIDRLVAVAKTLKFDGWLLNVENKIMEPQKLLMFVTSFHTALHSQLADPLLIWHDSVTIDGLLSWQNKLNSKNKDFFDACDGIFTNHSWTVKDIEESVTSAGPRLKDLYIGIDVWGHNFYGGGGFNIQEAVKVVYSFGCSLAICGPAWTHEAMSTNTKENELNIIENAENLSNYQKFLLRDRALWDSIWPFLNTRLPSMLPFMTSFCRGQGKKRRLFGDVICHAPWYNLKHMQYQPNAAHGPHAYLLSTQDVYTNTGKRETKGIIKLPDSKEKFTQMQKHMTEPSTTENKNNEIVNEEESEEEIPKKNFKAVIRRFFKKKSSRESLQAEESLHNASTGNSMLTVDVNIQLVPSAVTKTRICLAQVPEELECLEVFHEDSFIGGTCLKINPSDTSSPVHRTARLFFCDFLCEASLIICIVTKNLSENKDQFLNVYLYAVDEKGQEFRVTLVANSLPPANERSSSNSPNLSRSVDEYPCLGSCLKFKDLYEYIILNHPEFFIPVENSYNWKVFYFQVNLPGVRITSINCRTEMSNGAILLGHFGLCHRKK